MRKVTTTPAHSGGITPALEHIDVELTRRCNLKCVHCSAGGNSVGQELTTDDVKRILIEGCGLGLRKVGFTGGEPLLRRRKMWELVRFCRNELDLAIHLHTNGTMVSRKAAEEIQKAQIEATITLYGSRPRTHDSVTQTDGSMKSTLKGLQRLQQAGANLFVYIVPMKSNLYQIIPLIKMIFEMGCTKVRILSLCPTGRAIENFAKFALNNEEELWLNSELARIKHEINIELYAGYCTRQFYPELKTLPGHNTCLAAEDRIHIDALGNVFPCTASSGRAIFSVGNLRKPNYSLAEIWHKSPFFQFLRVFHLNPPGKCRACSLHKNCMSGCRILMAHKYGDVTIADPKCRGPY